MIQTEADGAHRPWRRPLAWLERIVLVGLLVFATVRFAPQIGALLGVDSGYGPAPDIAFVSLDGETVSADDLEGNVVVLNFWATWCLPCRLEMPSLQSLHEDLAREGVTVLGLSTDSGPEEPIREFLSKREISYEVGRATRSQRAAFGGISGIPTTFVIDRDGVIRHRVVGYFAPPALRAAVSRLAEP